MRAVAFLLISFSAASSLAAETYIIDQYDFTWTIATSEDATLAISKTDETTLVRLREDYNSISMTPEDAVKVGHALAKVSMYFRKMRGGQDASENEEAGGFSVSFSNSKEHGFYVHIRKADAIVGSSITLSRSQAVAFAPWLRKSLPMANYVDTVIDGALVESE